MSLEVIAGEIGIDDITMSAADAARVGKPCSRLRNRAVQAVACARESCRWRFNLRGVSSKTSRAGWVDTRSTTVTQVDEGIDLQELAGLDQRTQDGGSMRGGFTARKQPVLAA